MNGGAYFKFSSKMRRLFVITFPFDFFLLTDICINAVCTKLDEIRGKYLYQETIEASKINKRRPWLSTALD